MLFFALEYSLLPAVPNSFMPWPTSSRFANVQFGDRWRWIHLPWLGGHPRSHQGLPDLRDMGDWIILHYDPSLPYFGNRLGQLHLP